VIAQWPRTVLPVVNAWGPGQYKHSFVERDSLCTYVFTRASDTFYGSRHPTQKISFLYIQLSMHKYWLKKELRTKEPSLFDQRDTPSPKKYEYWGPLEEERYSPPWNLCFSKKGQLGQEKIRCGPLHIRPVFRTF
jgi:hypothetical protein